MIMIIFVPFLFLKIKIAQIIRFSRYFHRYIIIGEKSAIPSSRRLLSLFRRF